MIGRNVLIQMTSGSLGSLISFFTLALAARLFGPSVLGNLAYVISLFGLTFAISDLGFSRAHVHFTAGLKKAGKTFGTFIRIKLALLFLSFLIVILIALVNKVSFKGLFSLMLLYELFTRFAETVFITFEGLQQALPQNTARIIGKLFRLIAVAALGFVLKNNLGYSLTFVVEGLILAVIALVLIRRFKPLVYSQALAKKYFRYSLPFFAIVPLSYLQSNGIVVILKNLTNATQVGYFSATFGLASFIKSLFGAVMIFFFPKISTLFSKKDIKSIQHYADLTIRYLLIIFIPIFIFAFLVRHELVSLVLGSAFSPAVSVFSLFLLGMFLLMIFSPYDHILFATRQHRPLVKVNLVSLALTVLLSLILIPSLGARGAVLTNLIVWAISGTWRLWLVKSRLKLKLLPQIFAFISPAVIILLFFSWFLTYLPSILMLKLLMTLLAPTVYLLILFSLKLISLKDFKYFTNLIKFK